MRKSDLGVTPGSGNVFADLGFAEPELELAKADLLLRLQRVIRRRRLRPAAAAAILKVERPVVSALLRGQLTKLSIESLSEAHQRGASGVRGCETQTCVSHPATYCPVRAS